MKITFPRVRFPRIAWPRIARRVKHRTPVAPGPVTGVLGGLRTAALALVAVLVIAASLVSFAESYRGLYLWAHRHGLAGIWAAIWPLQVDVFIAVGELALFIALVDQWRTRQRAAAWVVTLAGLAVSVAGNIGHVAGHSLTVRATAAVPPLAAASALAVGLGVLKRVVESGTSRERLTHCGRWSRRRRECGDRLSAGHARGREPLVRAAARNAVWSHPRAGDQSARAGARRGKRPPSRRRRGQRRSVSPRPGARNLAEAAPGPGLSPK